MNLIPSDVMRNMSDTAWLKAAIGRSFGLWFQGTCGFVHAMPQFDLRAVLNVRTPCLQRTVTHISCCFPGRPQN